MRKNDKIRIIELSGGSDRVRNLTKLYTAKYFPFGDSTYTVKNIFTDDAIAIANFRPFPSI